MAQIGTARSSGWNRLTALGPAASALILAAVIALIAYGLYVTLPYFNPPSSVPVAAVPNGGYSDDMLYRDASLALAKGQAYYPAVAELHRAHNYPLAPFYAIRLPTEAWIGALVGIDGLRMLTALVVLLGAVAWGWRCGRDRALPVWAALSGVIVAANLLQALPPQWSILHEVPAGALITLAVALYRPERLWPSFVVMAAAVAIRETALPVAAVMGLFALIDRQWRSVVAWIGFAIVFFAIVGLHAYHVAQVVRPDDIASAGWTAGGGWQSYIRGIWQSSGLRIWPSYWTAPLVPLAWLGWICWRDRTANLVLVVLVLYAGAMMFAARPDNFYWAMLFTPLLSIGLIFAPAALWTLLGNLFSSNRKLDRRRA